MILATHTSYPNTRAWVLKLHRDAQPGCGRFSGLLENVSTGRRCVFANASELLACLTDAELNPFHKGNPVMITCDYQGEADLIVSPADSALSIALAPTDQFPEVFASSRMIALMEVAAARAMAPLLGEGQLSVGVALDVRHLAATPVGSRVRAVATYLRSEGKRMVFAVEAFDECGLIGEGQHSRAIVEAARLASGAERRRGPKGVHS